MVGREGMLGAHLALGVATAPLRALVQGAGIGLAHRRGRISAPSWRSSAALQRVLRPLRLRADGAAGRPPRRACAFT